MNEITKTGLKITLKAARVNAGITQEEAARRLGISPATLTRWESGQTLPRANALVQLCGLYNMPIEHLFLCTEKQV